MEKRGHDFVILLTTKNGFKTIFLPKALPHSDKVRFDFFHLEKTYIQDTHTPTREEGRQVNVFSDHAADFTSIKGFNTVKLAGSPSTRKREEVEFYYYRVNTRGWVCWCLGAIVVVPSQRWIGVRI